MKTILLIDDNENFKLIIKDLLCRDKEKNFNIIEANNPLDALEHFYRLNKNIDLVICDFYLPVQNGNELLEIIKQQSPSTKCLLISADTQLKSKNYKFVDHTFSKHNLDELIKYIKS